MKKFRFWIIISLVVVFLAGVVGGIFCERWLISKRPEMKKRPPIHFPSFKELNLTPEQQEKIKEIFSKNDERIRGLRSDFYKHLEEMRAQLKSEVDGVLTPEQKQKLEAMIQKFREYRKKKYEKREKNIERERRSNSRKENSHEKEDYHRSSNPGDYLGHYPGIYLY